MNINELTNYKAISIQYPTWSVHFGRAVPIIDEGSFLRIENLHIIEKFRVINVEKQEARVTVTMKNGETVVLTVVEP